jgi:glycine/sarcosine N-methyltransferase
MNDSVSEFYNDLAENQHLIFKDWNASIGWHAEIFERLMHGIGRRLRILDCACGIGTQALGLAMRGHTVVGTDLSAGAIARARREAAARGLAMRFEVADFRELDRLDDTGFDAVLAADNALPHMESERELMRAAVSMASRLKAGGLIVASIRDYDRALQERPSAPAPALFLDEGRRRIVHQVWDWTSDRDYTVHQYITRETDTGWESRHYCSPYRAVRREELGQILVGAGLREVRWTMPEESGFYQPIVLARA